MKENKIYVFNPEHDMALANYTPYYKASVGIRGMADDLALLPAWYAGEGSWIKVARTGGLAWLQQHNGGICPSVREVAGWFPAEVRPWGWDPALRARLSEERMPVHVLPSDGMLQCIRDLSDRSQAAGLLRSLSALPGMCGEAVACTTADEVRRQVGRYGKSLLKAPWSGSGRGLMAALPETWNSNIEGWTLRILRAQGKVMVEPYYNKVEDFAMEFYAEAGGGVAFAGYSLFETDAHGYYKLNHMGTDTRIEQQLTAYVGVEVLQEVRRSLEKMLPVWIGGGYAGPLGVDMMVCRCADGFRLHPCVEVNLRMNMGLVSRLFFDRYVHPSSHGSYRIEYYPEEGAALEDFERQSAAHPLHVSDGRIRRGHFPLTPVSEDTHYRIYVVVEA